MLPLFGKNVAFHSSGLWFCRRRSLMLSMYLFLSGYHLPMEKGMVFQSDDNKSDIKQTGFKK